MTEKEKMLQGQWHDANFDKDLLEERRKAELLCESRLLFHGRRNN